MGFFNTGCSYEDFFGANVNDMISAYESFVEDTNEMFDSIDESLSPADSVEYLIESEFDTGICEANNKEQKLTLAGNLSYTIDTVKRAVMILIKKLKEWFQKLFVTIRKFLTMSKLAMTRVKNIKNKHTDPFNLPNAKFSKRNVNEQAYAYIKSLVDACVYTNASKTITTAIIVQNQEPTEEVMIDSLIQIVGNFNLTNPDGNVVDVSTAKTISQLCDYIKRAIIDNGETVQEGITTPDVDEAVELIKELNTTIENARVIQSRSNSRLTAYMDVLNKCKAISISSNDDSATDAIKIEIRVVNFMAKLISRIVPVSIDCQLSRLRETVAFCNAAISEFNKNKK